MKRSTFSEHEPAFGRQDTSRHSPLSLEAGTAYFSNLLFDDDSSRPSSAARRVPITRPQSAKSAARLREGQSRPSSAGRPRPGAAAGQARPRPHSARPDIRLSRATTDSDAQTQEESTASASEIESARARRSFNQGRPASAASRLGSARRVPENEVRRLERQERVDSAFRTLAWERDDTWEVKRPANLAERFEEMKRVYSNSVA